MTQIKVCGIKNAETLKLLAEEKVDYVGFVFAKSRRQVTAQQAGEMLLEVSSHPAAVGVFVNPSIDELDEVMSRATLQVIQLHGDESPSFCAKVKERFHVKVWKAIAVREEAGLVEMLTPYQGFVDAFLFDTHDPKLAGGTGRRFAWSQIPELVGESGETTCIIAGGINAENVGELLQAYAPPVIDISSGVETDGEKDHFKIKSFIKRVREHE